MRVYLDNAATTPMLPEVIEAMTLAMQTLHGNPSSIHGDGRKVRAAIEDSRKKVAKCIGASIGEVFFTSGGTESNNMAIKNSVRDLGVRRIITSPTEHHCGLHASENMEHYQNVELVFVKVNEKGIVDLAHLEELLQKNDKKTLVSLMHANNEIGTLLDIEKVGEICEKYTAYFHTDTVQTIGHFDINVQKTKVHFLSAGAHKFHGPKGCGFIYINSDAMLKPFIDGGSQERNMRGGTENVYGIVGMAKALEIAVINMEAHQNHIENIRKYMTMRLLEEFEDIEFNGDYDGKYLYTVLSVSFPPTAKSDLLLFNLDIAGISCSGGSACSSGVEEGSHVIAAINGHPDRKTIRFSFSQHNTIEEIDFVIEKLKTMVAIKQGELEVA
jgi:cysteine desulfurase